LNLTFQIRQILKKNLRKLPKIMKNFLIFCSFFQLFVPNQPKNPHIVYMLFEKSTFFVIFGRKYLKVSLIFCSFGQISGLKITNAGSTLFKDVLILFQRSWLYSGSLFLKQEYGSVGIHQSHISFSQRNSVSKTFTISIARVRFPIMLS
jgi:hypothetical protein